MKLTPEEDRLWKEFRRRVRESERIADHLPSAEELSVSPGFVEGVCRAAIAEAVFQAMKRQNLTAAKLSKKCGIPDWRIREVVTMAKFCDIKLSELARLSIALDLKIDRVFLKAWDQPKENADV